MRKKSVLRPQALQALRIKANGTVKEYGRKLGFKLVEQYAPGNLPAIACDENSWLEMRIPENRAISFTDEQELKGWLRELIDSNAGYVAIPDALRWGGDVSEDDDFRNPARGERLFDITEALCAMVQRRLAMRRTSKLFGWEYRNGYADGFSLAASVSSSIDWAALNRERSLTLGSADTRKITAPGLHCILSLFRQIRANKETGRNALKLHAEQGDLFTLVYSILRETSGLRQNEWKAGWYYIRNLERRSNAAADPDGKIRYNLQLLEFVFGVTDALAETRYAAAGGIRPEKEGDRNMLRALLNWSEVQGMAPEQMPDNHIAVFDEYIRRSITDTDRPLWSSLLKIGETQVLLSNGPELLTKAREMLSGSNALSKTIVLAALYVKAYSITFGDSRTTDELRPEMRLVMKQLVDRMQSGEETISLPTKEKAAQSCAISDLLHVFDLFSDTREQNIPLDKAFTGAVNVLSNKRIEQAG
jgi:hypothetical protein